MFFFFVVVVVLRVSERVEAFLEKRQTVTPRRNKDDEKIKQI